MVKDVVGVGGERSVEVWGERLVGVCFDYFTSNKRLFYYFFI